MARPKRYDDEYLLSCVDSYWTEHCRRNPGKISYKDLAAYLSESNKADLSSDTLKHNRRVHEKIDSLRTTAWIHPAGIHKEDAPFVESTGFSSDDYQHLAEANEKLKSFITRTYIQGICCHLVNEELNLNINSPVMKETVDRDVIKAGMKPFNSPVINELSAMFDLDEECNEQNKE